MEIYDHPYVPLRLTVRLLKAEVIETLPYGCMTWSPNNPDYDRLPTGSPLHAPPVPRMSETEARQPHPIVRQRACQESFREHRAIVRKRRILFAGFVARMGEERLPQRVMFGELAGGTGYSGRQGEEWMVHLKEDMSAFEMKFEGWRNDAQKAGKWFRRVEEGAE